MHSECKNEMRDQRWEEMNKFKPDEHQKPYEHITFDDEDLCVEVRHGHIAFPMPEEGLRKLMEYDSFYTEEERRQISCRDFYENTYTTSFDENYFVRLLQFYWDVPDNEMEGRLKAYSIERLRKKAKI